ncbi:acyltransferase [Aquirufa ecclesiirivi]|uniref:acyltransferase n=1 Tax=Aquirufa ecclesiirivi TaxID=2715124 RepID=UPI00197AA932|nr:acyltransferase [Aquirufa ecclesiirivi]
MKVGIESNTQLIIDSHKNSQIILGEINYFYRFGNLEVYDGGKIELGNNISINKGFCIVSRLLIKIGNDVMIGPNFLAYDHNHKFDDSGKSFNKQGYISKPIIIENNVWIGGNVFIASGVTIGSNAVIAAGSVVTKDVEKGNLVAGNPAKIVKLISE